MSFLVSPCPRTERPQVPSSAPRVTGSGPELRLEPPVWTPGQSRAGAVPTTASHPRAPGGCVGWPVHVRLPGAPGRQQAGPALPTALTRQRGVPQPHPAQRRGERPLGGPSSARARGGSGTFVCPQTGFERVGLWGVLSSVFSCLVRSVFINDVQRP